MDFEIAYGTIGSTIEIVSIGKLMHENSLFVITVRVI